MGMNTYVQGFRPPDEFYLKMKAVWDACLAAHMDPPDEVYEYFDGDKQNADGTGMNVDISDAVSNWDDGDMRVGLSVDLTKLPKGVTVLRFVNSY